MGRGRKPKTLAELVEHGTFRARKHAELLETEPLGVDTALRRIQRAYRLAGDADTAYQAALDFQMEAKRQHAARTAVAEEPPSMMELWTAEGMPCLAVDPTTRKTWRMAPGEPPWERWNKRHGLRYRVKWELEFLDEDYLELARLAGVKTRDVRKLRARRVELVKRAGLDLSGKIPGPAG
jgi:hypothetical protein